MNERYVIPSLERAFNVLTMLADQHRGLSLADLGRQSGIPKSTLFRILVTLQRHRFVLWNDDQRTYQLGSRLSELGTSFLEQNDVYHTAARYMKRLADASDETVFLGKIEDGEVLYLRRMESPRSVTVVKKLGQRVPAHCTATGVAVLAFLTEKEVHAILDAHGMRSFNETTITDRTSFLRRLEGVRRRGYAIVDGEYNKELLCVSAPVFDFTGRPVASLTVAMLAGRGVSEERLSAVSEMVCDSAIAFSHDLGYVRTSTLITT